MKENSSEIPLSKSDILIAELNGKLQKLDEENKILLYNNERLTKRVSQLMDQLQKSVFSLFLNKFFIIERA